MWDSILCIPKCYIIFFAAKMAVEKRLAFSIVQFLRDQTHCGALNSDEQESLEGRSVWDHCLFTKFLLKVLIKYCIQLSPIQGFVNTFGL